MLVDKPPRRLAGAGLHRSGFGCAAPRPAQTRLALPTSCSECKNDTGFIAVGLLDRLIDGQDLVQGLQQKMDAPGARRLEAGIFGSEALPCSAHAHKISPGARRLPPARLPNRQCRNKTQPTTARGLQPSRRRRTGLVVVPDVRQRGFLKVLRRLYKKTITSKNTARRGDGGIARASACLSRRPNGASPSFCASRRRRADGGITLGLRQVDEARDHLLCFSPRLSHSNQRLAAASSPVRLVSPNTSMNPIVRRRGDSSSPSFQTRTMLPSIIRVPASDGISTHEPA